MIRYFVAHRTAAFLLLAAFVALGALGLPGLQRDTFPEFAGDRIEVRIVYPGASTQEVEEALCLRIEDALDGLVGIRELRCTARENVAVATVEVLHGHDVTRLLTEVKTEVDAIDGLPDEVEDPIVRQLDTTDRVVSIAITGPMSRGDLHLLADGLKSRLLHLPEVARVEIQGFAGRQFRVELDELRLRALGLSVAAVAAAIERQSLDRPVGTVETRERDILVRFAEQRRSGRALETLVIHEGGEGGEIRLGDIATVTERFATDEERILFNGAPAALLAVHKSKAEDALRVMDAVEAFVAHEQARLPPGVQLALTDDTATLIRERLELLAVNALQGLVLVGLVMLVFFSIRFALTVALALPLSFLASFFVIGLTGHSINVLSTVGLLIAIGLLIDSAIVITENIAAHVRRGRPLLGAAVDGTREVAGGVLASFLTSICVFAPLGFLEGDIGRALRVVPLILIITLSASLIVSFLILPRFAVRALARERRHALRDRVDRGFEWFRDRVIGGLVERAMAWRYLTVGVMAAGLLASLALVAGGFVKFAAFPDVEGDIIEARLMLPHGTPLARTEATVDRVVEALMRVDRALTPDQPEARPLVQNLRVDFDRNPDYADAGAHLATVRADLLGSEIRSASADGILEAWRREVGRPPDVVSLTFQAPSPSPAGLPIDVRLRGDDLERLRAAAGDLAGWLARYDGVDDLTSDLHPGKPEVRIRLREGALALGVDGATIATQLRSAFHGATAEEIQLGRDSVEIDVRLDRASRSSLADLEDFVVTLADGRRVPLARVAVLEESRGYAVIPRIDGRRTVSVRGEVDTRRANANEVLADTQARLLPRLLADHPDIGIGFEGQAARQAETAGSLRAAFAVGLVGMFIVLSFQFRSYIEPVAVMLAIPLSLIGVVWGHFLMGLDLSMPSMVGFASLAGIVVNNSILLVVFLKGHVERGHPVPEAAKQASLDRFRPIFMTSATTIAGLLPLLFERSLQAQVLIPLVTSLAFGLLAATVLVLFFVPALYAILDDLGLARPPAPERERTVGTGSRLPAETGGQP